ncbi:hypothetical protein EU546_04910 [Candidatus Thorarchaeota archaeon]|nr:MAG: hypothetical protein EU546_04910 [Candidatus Thorarchaeota archaeon]
MVRLTTFSNILAGAGLVVLGVAAVFKYVLEGVGVTGTSIPLYAWLLSVGLLAVVVVMSVLNTFTEVAGYVHPEDKLVGNMFVFLMAIGSVLMFGILDEGQAYQDQLFDMASMIVIAYVFLFIFVFFMRTITEGGEVGQVKEMTARFMLVALLLGAVMAGLLFVLDAIQSTFASYEIAAATLGIFAFALVLVVVFALGRRYEPVGE